MTSPAQQAGVLVAGLAGVAPMLDVMDLADLLGGAATDAAAVPRHEPLAEASADLAPGPAEDDVAGVLVEDAGQDAGIAGDGQGFLLGEPSPVG